MSQSQESHLDAQRKAAENMIEKHPLEAGEPTQISPHVSRLLCPNPSVFTGPGTNTYIIHDGDDLVIIDPGPNLAAHIDRIKQLYQGKNILAIMVTHTHGDHSPGVAPLKELWSVPTYGRVADHSSSQDKSFTPDHVLQDGDEFVVGKATIQAVLTPGHASNHVCFLIKPDNMLLSGDHVMQGSTVVVGPPDGDMKLYMESLKKLIGLEADKIAPAHGHVLKQPEVAMNWLYEHRLARENRVVKALENYDEPKTAKELVAEVYHDTHTSLHGIASHSLLAHLLKLFHDNKVTKTGDSFKLIR